MTSKTITLLVLLCLGLLIGLSGCTLFQANDVPEKTTGPVSPTVESTPPLAGNSLATPTPTAGPAPNFFFQPETGKAGTAMETDTYAESAPEFPTYLEWLNTERPLSMAELRGKIVLLDFWTYGCVNCMQNFPDLKRLAEEHPEELVVIGVHSAKFPNERLPENVRQMVLRYELEYPVINDARRDVWYEWGIKAWPTAVLVDPFGNLAGFHVGENVYHHVKPVINLLLKGFDDRIDRTPLDLQLERTGLPETVLSFPSDIRLDPNSERMFISDTNNHRLLIANRNTGQVEAIIGQGERGLDDGGYTEATFNRPHGLALSPDGQTLYVADTDNHAVRAVDLAAQTVRTLAGTGTQTRDLPPVGGAGPETDLASPWDVLVDGDDLYVAMAGSHQLWRFNLPSGRIDPYVGNAFEGTIDGPFAEATLAQPSGMTLGPDRRLYFADSESSAIRYADLNREQTGTLTGQGMNLFDYGDLDGVGTEVRLQHPLDVVYVNDAIYLVDTYNSKIKRLNPQTQETVTIAGDEHGWRDGSDPRFFEPGGLDGLNNQLYIADTNNHSIRIYDLDSGEAQTLVLRGLEQFALNPDRDAPFRGTLLELPPQQVRAGNGEILLNITLPEGYKMNPLAASAMRWESNNSSVVLAPDANRELLEPDFPLDIAATFSSGSSNLQVDLALFYCEAEQELICLIDTARLQVPVEVVDSGAADLVLDYEVILPEF